MLVKRSIQPGYGSELCSVEVIEAVNCGFAKQVFALYARERYGVDQCVEDEYDKLAIKKELLDLNLIYDPDMCKTVVCLAPTDVVVAMVIFNPGPAEEPVIPEACVAPTDVVVTIV
jgi:hypothetical protein